MLHMKRIAIVGAGFVGLRVARLLAKHAENRFTVVLIDKKDRFLFTPWLIDMLAGKMPLEQITASIPTIAKRDGFIFIKGEVHDINRKEKTFTIHAEGTQKMTYDKLVLAHGADTCYYGIPGAKEHTLPLKSIGDAKRAQESLLHLMREAEQIADSKERARLLTLAVVGGGPSGIEAIFSIKNFIQKKQTDGTIDPTLSLRYHLIQAAPQILPGFSQTAVNIANRELDNHSIQTYTSEAVIKIEKNTIYTVSGKMIPAHFILWTAGIEACPINIDPNVEIVKGYPTVDNYLRLDDSIFCAGDISNLKTKGVHVPKTAQVAMEMAEVVAANILKEDAGARLRPFHAETKGTIITLGKTGFVDLFHTLAFETPLANKLRRAFYRFRFKQMTGLDS